ncbi:MAG: hypothetical protein J6X77_01430 [Bacteroidales bacterium]|nr:hypothetical protein [Bacteroidales bacterium]
MVKRLLIALAVAALLPLTAQAQTSAFDALKKKNDQKFQDHKAKVENTYRGHREAVNKQFEEALRQPWSKKSGKKAVPTPKKKEKDIPPVVIKDKDKQTPPKDKPIVIEEITVVPTPGPEPTPTYPIEEVPVKDQKTVEFTIYGTVFKVRCPGAPAIAGVEENQVADCWSALSGADYDNMLVDLLAQKKSRSLCDWAYLKVVDKLSETVCGSTSAPEAVVLQTYILTQSGFRVYMARDSRRSLHKLVATDYDVYKYPYVVVDGRKCYMFDRPDDKSYYVMGKSFAGTVPMSVLMVKENSFATASSDPRDLKSRDFPAASVTVSSNKNLMEFYNDYPESFANNDGTTKWRFYANTPMSSIASEAIYPKLKEVLKGKNDFQAASILLNFVQTAFVYEYDNKVWGRDRAFFADETLFYPYSDCEDRSILFSRLVRDLVGRPVVLLYYPGHLATAVNFSDSVSGDYLIVDGQKYVVCDPTYVGAPVGLTMPGMDNGGARVIKL